MVISKPGAHPKYLLDIEPHLFAHRTGNAAGPGVRGTLILVDNGFVPTINNSVGIGVGLDYLTYSGGGTLAIPVVMQWNFWLSNKWSVFGEPGVWIFPGGSGVKGNKGDNLDLISVAVGGRYLFKDTLSLEMRAGNQGISVGVGFLF